MTAGGGVDLNLTEHIGLRLLQAEYFLAKFKEEVEFNQYLWLFSEGQYGQNLMRLSTGFIFRFGK